MNLTIDEELKFAFDTCDYYRYNTIRLQKELDEFRNQNFASLCESGMPLCGSFKFSANSPVVPAIIIEGKYCSKTQIEIQATPVQTAPVLQLLSSTGAVMGGIDSEMKPFGTFKTIKVIKKIKRG